MTITGARWTPAVNLLAISCECGRTFEHRADRWTIRCRCGQTAHLGRLRDEYAAQGSMTATTPPHTEAGARWEGR